MTLLYSDVYGEISLKPSTNDMGGDMILGAEALHYKGRAGEILIQHQLTKDYSFYFANYLFNSRNIVSFQYSGFALQTLVALDEDIDTLVHGAGNSLLRKEHFLITHNPSNEMSFVFEKGKKYVAFGASFNLTLIEKYLQLYLQPEEMSKFFSNIVFTVTNEPVLAFRKILDVINDIKRNTLPKEISVAYTAIKLQELFVMQLTSVFTRPQRKMRLSERQLEALEIVRQKMIEDFSTHYTLEELAKIAHINLHVLKNGFKDVYGLAPYEYLKDAKLLKAKELIKQTDKPLKQIAALVNYSGLSSFIAAFTAHFGYSPGSVRK